jgi:phage baseplate assembly protein W
MAELWHQFGSDLSLSATGDLLTASGSEQTRQRILRRLLTNPGDYIWHPDYGAGLGRFIGQPGRVKQIQGVIRAQVLQEPTVARTPPPTITVTAGQNGTYTASIEYTDAATGIRQPVLSVQIDNTTV